MVNRTQVWLDYKGLSKETGDARDRGGVLVNDNLINAQDYYLQQSGKRHVRVSSVGTHSFLANGKDGREAAVASFVLADSGCRLIYFPSFFHLNKSYNTFFSNFRYFSVILSPSRH